MQMVGMMAGSLRDEAVTLLNSYKYNSDTASKMEPLRHLREILIHRDPSLLSEFVPYLMELQSERSSPIRKYLAEMIEEIGLKYSKHLPEMVPVLMAFLRDDTPAVARQAVTSGTNLFRNTLECVALQGIYSGQVDNWLENSWTWMVKFKDAIYPIAFQPGTDGIRSLAVKFVETTILLFTPDPNGSSRPPPPQQTNDGKSKGFDISWIVGGHPVLDAGVLGQEASKNLGLLLDQLRLPDVRMLHSSVVIVLVNSLAAIARKRPALYGRILLVLLGLGPSCEALKGGQLASAQHALKNAFVSFLKCSHPGAMPWRDRLVVALQAMDAGDVAEQALRQVDRIRRNVDRTSREPQFVREERPSGQPFNTLVGEAGMKRPLETGNQGDIDDVSGKRPRVTSSVPSTVPPVQQFQSNNNVMNESGPSNGNSAGGLLPDTEMTPVQQLVAMFGAFVAQGDRAAESLEILISRISPDLLAEVVIANMHNLPSSPPAGSDEDETELPLTCSASSVLGAVSQVMAPLTMVSQAIALSTTLPQVTSSLTTTPLVSLAKSTSSSSEVNLSIPQHLPTEFRHEPRRDPHLTEPRHMPVSVSVPLASARVEDTGVMQSISGAGLMPSTMLLSVPESEGMIGLPETDQVEAFQSIPGLDGPVSAEVKMDTAEEAIDSFSEPPASIYPPSMSASDSAGKLEVSLSGPTTTDKSEPKIVAASGLEPKMPYSLASFMNMSGGPAPGSIAVPPIVPLTKEQQTLLSRSAFGRIIEAYKQVASAGGSDLRLALLSRLTSQCNAEYDIRGLLQKHILSDYQNNKGHELTLHVLYELFGEIISQQKETVSSSEATPIYENFLLFVAQTLRDSLPASDKSLSKLLGEVPFLPDAALELLKDLCYAGKFDREGKEVLSGDRVTQGLSAVWSLILVRPPSRVACLDIALQSAVHGLEEVRTKAIRLVANKLYPLNYISRAIEEFATNMLLSVVDGTRIQDSTDIDESRTIEKKDANQQVLSNGGQRASGIAGDNSVANDQLSSAQSISTVSVPEAQRCMSLYFALCTKKHALLLQVFRVYRNAPKAVKQAVHRHIPILIRTIGSSAELLRIISDPPPGSENLLMQVLHILTDGTTPSADLIATVKRLYEIKAKDAGILIPVLSSLTKDEVLPIFPRLVDLPLEKFQAALARILQGSSHTGPALTPAEVLIAIHGIDPERDGIPLKKVTDACSTCFEQRAVFTQQVLAKVLNQLVEQTPLPLLFMRTVIQAIGAFPALVDFIMEILSRLVSKQIWRFPKLWVGFLKCAYQTKPHSYHVLLQLPAVQLENALNKNPALKAPLVAHANQPNIRSTLPRSTLVVLGLVQDTQPANSIPQNVPSTDAGPSGQTATETQASESVAGS